MTQGDSSTGGRSSCFIVRRRRSSFAGPRSRGCRRGCRGGGGGGGGRACQAPQAGEDLSCTEGRSGSGSGGDPSAGSFVGEGCSGGPSEGSGPGPSIGNREGESEGPGKGQGGQGKGEGGGGIVERIQQVFSFFEVIVEQLKQLERQQQFFVF